MFCLWSHADPVFVLARYAGILAMHHTGEAILAGISEFRPLIAQLMGDPSEVDAIAGSIAVGLLAGICVAGIQEGRVRKRVLYAAPPLVACWSLMTFYHLTYGFLILLPVLMLLALHDTGVVQAAPDALLAASARHDVRHPRPQPSRRSREHRPVRERSLARRPRAHGDVVRGAGDPRVARTCDGVTWTTKTRRDEDTKKNKRDDAMSATTQREVDVVRSAAAFAPRRLCVKTWKQRESSLRITSRECVQP